MAGLIDDAFRTNAISLEDAVGIFYSTADPSVGAGFVAPVGSLLLRDSGEAWVKIGTADTSWSLLQSGGTPLNSVTVRDEGVLVGNFSTLNFTGTGVTVTDAGGIAQVSIPTPVSVFGSEFQYTEDSIVSSTTSLTYVNKLNFTTSSLVGGVYRIGYSYRFNHDSNNNDFLGRVLVDDTIIIDELVQEPTDSQGNFGGSGSDQRYVNCGFKYVTFTAGTHNIKIQYATDTSSIASSVWDARIEVWRVS